ncbi:unnamed protein product [Ceratitis capitata]|uniref:(Mediterranean fruit fly) hypothetical protein n=1 Tax=Ceratitis capitata TaxID=7213 RepID=A0A811U6D1_CERCA|nr:unnamed protein product [Ceratitis capitata]
MTLKLQPGEMINSKLCCQQIASLQQAILTNRLIEKPPTNHYGIDSIAHVRTHRCLPASGELIWQLLTRKPKTSGGQPQSLRLFYKSGCVPSKKRFLKYYSCNRQACKCLIIVIATTTVTPTTTTINSIKLTAT